MPARTGILGGTFDPIHRGHIAMARAARERKQLDRVLVIPSNRPPHKAETHTPAEKRLAMVVLATRPEEGLEACDLEIRRGGVSYTVETLEELTRRQPGAELFFIIGEDSIAELPRWKDISRILELARILTVPRPGSNHSFDSRRFPGVPSEILEACERDRLSIDPVPISSREIREAIRMGHPFEDDLPDGVGDYIRQHGLYEFRE